MTIRNSQKKFLKACPTNHTLQSLKKITDMARKQECKYKSFNLEDSPVVEENERLLNNATTPQQTQTTVAPVAEATEQNRSRGSDCSTATASSTTSSPRTTTAAIPAHGHVHSWQPFKTNRARHYRDCSDGILRANCAHENAHRYSHSRHCAASRYRVCG